MDPTQPLISLNQQHSAGDYSLLHLLQLSLTKVHHRLLCHSQIGERGHVRNHKMKHRRPRPLMSNKHKHSSKSRLRLR